MMSDSFHRKWRPKSFEELVGQTPITTVLTKFRQLGRWPQALLFSGPRGVGKTSSARIVAKTLRCSSLNQGMPCLKCSECLSIDEGSNLNVMEIDGASHNGVDDVRALVESIKYQPESGLKKIYIVDEVHMLSQSAFNAFLKTLEEPPEHVLFVFATTEEHKLPETIVSRCQRFQFQALSVSTIVEQLSKICDAENIRYEKPSLVQIAKQAGGALRDAEVLLDQLSSALSKDLKLERISSFLGLASTDLTHRILQSLLQKQEKELLAHIKTLRSTGINPIVFLQGLIQALRNALFLKASASFKDHLSGSSQDELQQLQSLIASTSITDLHLLFDLSLKAYKDLGEASDAFLVLEVLLLRLLHFGSLEKVETLLSPKGPSSSSSSSPSSAAPQSARPQETSSSETAPQDKPPSASPLKDLPNVADQYISALKKKTTATVTASAPAPKQTKKEDQSPPPDAFPWRQYLGKVAKINPLFHSQLKYAFVISFKSNQLKLGFAKKDEMFFKALNSKLQPLSNLFSSLVGAPISLSLDLVENQQHQSLSVQEEDARKRQQQIQKVRDKVLSDPNVQIMQEIFPEGHLSLVQKKNSLNNKA